MFGAEPYQFKPTYPPGEEPATHGEGEERSASPELYRPTLSLCLYEASILSSLTMFPIATVRSDSIALK